MEIRAEMKEDVESDYSTSLRLGFGLTEVRDKMAQNPQAFLVEPKRTAQQQPPNGGFCIIL